jgi:hypothetical protein
MHNSNPIMKTLFRLILGPAAGFALAWNTAAFDTLSLSWSGAHANMRAGSGTYGTGSDALSALEEVINAWNDNPSEFSFTLITGDNSVWFPNFQNETWASASDFWFDDDNTLAVTKYWGLGNFIEADVIVRSSLDHLGLHWMLGHAKSSHCEYGGSGVPLQLVLLHELGHALGLDHEDDTYNVMGDCMTHVNANGDTLAYYPGEDACHGAVHLYTLDSTDREDVAVTHWKYQGSWEGYSTHMRTHIKKKDGTTATVHDTSPELVFAVSKGHTILLELTFENNGASYQEPNVCYYLSDDNQIETTDRPLATRSPGLWRGEVYTTTQELVIPSDLTSGQHYYLGAIVDYDHHISEVRGDNNATYVGIYIK